MRNSKPKNIQLPAQTGFYKIKVKTDSTWRFFDTCRLQISVGQEKHEGAKFDATMDWVSHRFEKIIVCVNDTLQRFNLMADTGIPEAEARARSLEEGDRWIGQVLTLHLDKNPEIFRWDHWLSQPNYAATRKQINDLCKNDAQFRDAIDSEVETFMERRRQDGKSVTQYHRDLSREFLMEECAVFRLMFERDRAADIYPGTTLLPVVLAEEGKIEGYVPSGNTAFTRIDFSRNRNFQTLTKGIEYHESLYCPKAAP